MTLADLFRLEPAPIYGQFVKRVEPLGPWETQEQPRGEKGFASAHPPEFIEAIRAGRVTREEAYEAGMSYCRFYRIRKWGK